MKRQRRRLLLGLRLYGHNRQHLLWRLRCIQRIAPRLNRIAVTGIERGLNQEGILILHQTLAHQKRRNLLLRHPLADVHENLRALAGINGLHSKCLIAKVVRLRDPVVEQDR